MADIHVQVCYVRPDLQFLRDLNLPQGGTVEDAVRQSGVLQAAPEIDMSTCRVGIYGKLKPLDTVLRAHDRVEIYRRLVADPKESRRRRAGKSGDKKAR